MPDLGSRCNWQLALSMLLAGDLLQTDAMEARQQAGCRLLDLQAIQPSDYLHSCCVGKLPDAPSVNQLAIND